MAHKPELFFSGSFRINHQFFNYLDDLEQQNNLQP